MISGVFSRILRSSAGPYLALFLTALVALFFRLGSLPFIGADEPRYARIAEEMSQSEKWVTPVLEGYPWLEKPPLYYWITMPFYRMFGVSETVARLGPALCALLAAASILWLGSKLWSRSHGFLASMILLTSIGFAAFGRSASPDIPFTATFTVALSILAAAVLCDGGGLFKTAAAYILLGMAVLAKGPVAVILIAGIVLLFWVVDEHGGSLQRLHLFAGAAIVAVVSIPWFWLAFRENGFSFISVFFINHHLARYVSDIHHHTEPVYYFIPVLMGLFFPWTGWLPALLPSSLRRWKLNWRDWDRGAVFLGCWALFPFIFFSLSSSKLAGYVLPSMPPLALLLGRALDRRMQEGTEGQGMSGGAWCHLILSLAVALAFPFVLRQNYGGAWQAGIPLAAAVAVPAFLAFRWARNGRNRTAMRATMIQGVLLVLSVTIFAFPPMAAYHSTAAIARQALSADAEGEPIITFCYFHHTLHYYTNYRIDANIVDPAALATYAVAHPSFLVVTEAGRMADLERIQSLSVTQLGEQGKLRLLRIRRFP